MPVPAESPRSRADACPGALTTHEAADGRLARVRIPGGQLTAAALRVLADCAQRFGDGELHLTSRANVQVRGLDSGDELAVRLAEAGLLPSASHERVRNIVASPLSGVAGGVADVRLLARELDEAVCANARLTTLPGRFLFGLDDGRGDIVDDRIDACWLALSRDHGALVLAGADTGLRITTADAPRALVATAVAFTEVRGDAEHGAWQVRELGAQREAIVEAVARAVEAAREAPHEVRRAPKPVVGPLGRDDGGTALVVGLPFGVLSAERARLLAVVGGTVVLTPWRTVVVPKADPAAAASLREAGLILDARAPELAISACIGHPGCVKSLADVRGDVMKAIHSPAGGTVPGSGTAHFSGCGRRCGRPQAAHVDVLAERGGYLVDGDRVPTERLAEALTAKAVLTAVPATRQEKGTPGE
ncbi:MAG: precorrin-3B synthase [Haloechinothrix sp.]